MPFSEVNGITINYSLDQSDSAANGDLVVLINGLADDLTTWSAQIPALLAAGYTVLRYDNRGIGLTSAPPGPYTSELLAQDLHALLMHPDLADKTSRFHLLGVSMGGMIAQTYALLYPNGSEAAQGREMLSLGLCCTYAQPTVFCERMFGFWADVAVRMGVREVMRDVTLWAFTIPFFRQRTDELQEVEDAMSKLEMSTEAYLSQLNVIQKFDTVSALESLSMQEKGLGNLPGHKVLVLAGKVDILIPVVLSRELAEKIEGAQFLTVKGGHACMWEFPDDFNKTVIKFLDEVKESKS